MKAICLSLLLTLALLLSLAARPSLAGTWYFCDPAHAYYPYVKTCPAPWHPVAAPNPGPVPPGALARPVQDSAGYKEGFKAHKDFWAWRAYLTGDYAGGANYWTWHRNAAKPGTCDEPVGLKITPDPTWTQGCEDAKQRLEPADKDMKGKVDFRAGWVAFKPSPEAIAAARKARAGAAVDAEPPTPDAAPADAAPPAADAPPPPAGAPPPQNGY